MNRSYTESQLEMAVEATTVGCLGIREAHRLFGIPFTTLRRRIIKGQKTFLKPGTRPALDCSAEEEIVQAINAAKEDGCKLSRKEV